MSEIKLKPCPHCKNKNLEFTDVHSLEECGNFDTDLCLCNKYEHPGHCIYKSVVCSVQRGGCGASSGYYLTEEEAAKAWNRRYTDE
ncbi:Lar family restriction alleviation protein [Mediterraneibacter sp. NSJ-55]|uniref:Lar family restriction alleviation protein n=1 Tax=Mediterraneibacter hominis TaxID=2763054 RepID=A0A923RPZ5_9FIRM|nr:Lar family restriction alleviation protein [Mediterraneibacter hominis]MBC5688128.1 Lar family restriction alleviation protein [Mediterraneibacter hominis]